jgi:RNA polymerase sigma-70 factor, ECF subfamily
MGIGLLQIICCICSIRQNQPWHSSVSIDASESERHLVEALRAGDETAFVELVETHQSWMLRTASSFVPAPAVAEDIVQETWISVLRAVDGFEGRSALRTWIFSILVNAAKKRAAAERRTVPWSAFDEPAGDEALGDRFFEPSHPRWANCWTSTMPNWDDAPDIRLMAAEAWRAVERTLEKLPFRQRLVFTLRDVEHWSSDEVCDALEISGSNERVLLHRARLRIRSALERHYASGESAC